MGSDHCILAVTVLCNKSRKRIGCARVINWHAWRKDLAGLPEEAILAIEEGTQERLGLAYKHTSVIATTGETLAVDLHLFHL